MAHLLRVLTDSMETIAALWVGAIVATQLDSSRPGPGWPHRIIEPQLASWLVMSACRVTGGHHARRDTQALVCYGADSCAFLWTKISGQAVATSALEGREHLHSCRQLIAAMRNMYWTHQCVGHHP